MHPSLSVGIRSYRPGDSRKLALATTAGIRNTGCFLPPNSNFQSKRLGSAKAPAWACHLQTQAGVTICDNQYLLPQLWPPARDNMSGSGQYIANLRAQAPQHYIVTCPYPAALPTFRREYRNAQPSFEKGQPSTCRCFDLVLLCYANPNHTHTHAQAYLCIYIYTHSYAY